MEPDKERAKRIADWADVEDMPAPENLRDLPELTPEEFESSKRAGLRILKEFEDKWAAKEGKKPEPDIG